ncbi:MAG: hypothetical protein N0C84_01030 [Candidatus Thiodiazotropha taylori]|uniref:Uncharacterized protein n=1 Tax=Candidatus Thiodiazotropha taylori TaxID=2792791 RepID=A0A9E4K9F3_9GAMM|nr:hypothetical protein [Candidatus Thiodiazotropha taylori]MCW4255029.1 hypothetical protein [Candidatus Thiodiazotropha taylori]
MRLVIRDIIDITGCDEEEAHRVETIMGEHGVDFSEISSEDFDAIAMEIYEKWM